MQKFHGLTRLPAACPWFTWPVHTSKY